MLKSLFRPKWQHKDANVRLQAVKTINIKDSELLKKIALSDPDETVRQTAISRINQLQILKQLHDETSFDNDKAHIQSCWCSVLSDINLTPPIEAENIVLDCDNPEKLAAIVRYSNNQSLKHLALTGLQDESVIFQLLENSRDSLLWQRLTEQLQGEQALRKALELIKGRDKRTTQLLRQRLENISKEQQIKEQIAQQRAHIESKLEELLNSEYTPLMEGILLNFQQQLENPDLHSEKSADLLVKCQNKLLEQQQQEQTERVLQENIAAAEALLNSLSDTLSFTASEQKQLEALKNSDSLIVQDILAKIEQLTNAIESFNTLERNIAAEESKAKKYELITQALQLVNRQAALKKHHQTSLQQQANLLKNQKKEEHHSQEKNKAQLQSIIEQADNAIAHSDLAMVNKLYRKAREQFNRLSSEDKGQFQAAMQRMQASNKELQEWQEFATDPIREELCQAMERLINSKEPANTIARSIKDIQQQWKQLGYCHDQALWQRFQNLSNQAYEPCKLYFEEQKERKQFNAQQCQIICEQVEKLSSNIDWQTTDYATLDKLLKSIDKEWKKYNFLERKAYQDLNARYRQAKQPLLDKLRLHKQDNLKQLEQLLAQAQSLLELEDANLAHQNYQEIHESWKTVGITFYKPQQTLWQQLRETGDAIYQKRSLQRNEIESQLQANAKSVAAIIEQIKEASSNEQIEQYQKEFAKIGDLPRNQYRKIHADFNAAIADFQSKQKKAKLDAELSQLEELISWSATQDTQAIPEHWPQAWVQQLGQTKDASEAEINALCVQAEILADIPSAKEDETLRIQIQMQQLQERFNQGETASTLDSLSQLILGWASLNKQAISDLNNKQQRFKRALTAIKDKCRA